MVDPHTNGCPEPEVLAAYVDRGLSLAERARVDAHLASCPQCIAQVAGVARMVGELSALRPDRAVIAESTPLITGRSVAGALAAAAAVIAVLATPALVRPWLERDSGLVSLVDNVGEQRSVLGRLTGGFPHAPLGAPSAGGQDGRAAGTDRVQLTAGRIRESFGERKTPSQLHALGVSQLLAGRYDDAALSLQAASREQPANAQYLSDVAAVQIERARLGLRPDDLPRALAAADRARRLDPSLKEAWFNRALAASALSLTEDAKGAWTEYLKRDSVSPWAGEARKRLDDLSKPTRAAAWTVMEGRLQSAFDASTADEAVRTQTTEARNFIENTLLVNWSKAVLNGGSGDAELERVRVMAAAMQRVAGDAIYVDAVAAIDRSNGDSRKAIAQAHRDYASAAALFNDDRFAAAAPGFASARLKFADSPFSVLAGLHQGAIAYVTGRGAEAASTLNATLATARSRGYAYADGRSTWFLGLMAVGQSHFAEAQSRYEETLDTFSRMGDVEQAGAAHNLLAVLHDYLGASMTAWQHRLAAFESLSVSRSPKFQYQVLSTAVPSMRAESPDAALAMQEAALAVARRGGREAIITETLAQRASLLASLNRSDEAAASLTEARQHLPRVPDAAFRARIEGGILATESDMFRKSDPGAAVAAATRAIELINQRRDRLRLAQLQLRLAKANIVWGRTEQARVALDRGLGIFNEERAASTEQLPISALDESWQLFDTSIQLSLKEKDYERAFALAEAARSTSASELKKFGGKTLRDVQAALQPNEAILALNQFDDEIAVWVIKANSVNVTIRPMSRRTSEQLIARQQNEVWQGAQTSAGRDLYNEIVRPVAAQLTAASRVIVVPDSTFQPALFAGFYNPTSNRFLVEEVSVRMAPSAAAFAATATASIRTKNVDPLIVNGVDASNAAEIASAYESSQRLSGAAATRERFFADAANHRIVHLSARTSTNTSYPLLSRVVVADEPGVRYSGEILGSDIAQHALPETSIVVIDDAKAASFHRGEGTSSLARAFLTAGVPAVVGTLPGADENATRDLLISFHREMSKGVSAEQALTTVQRNAIQQNGRRLGAWTALVLYGSDR
ncbi:MAG TPA: CHAT domain-containing protein [Vicinamibacterales bacterium]|nr:CHAT domain-containing protein [Vicinamibacterales bacterium]